MHLFSINVTSKPSYPSCLTGLLKFLVLEPHMFVTLGGMAGGVRSVNRLIINYLSCFAPGLNHIVDQDKINLISIGAPCQMLQSSPD